MAVTTKFKVDQNHGVVVCIIETDPWEVVNKIKKYGLSVDPEVIIDTTKTDNLYSRTYVGIAKCAPEDTFDENYGKKLAEYRAGRKRKNFINGQINKYVGRSVTKLNNLCRYGYLKDSRPPKD